MKPTTLIAAAALTMCTVWAAAQQEIERPGVDREPAQSRAGAASAVGEQRNASNLIGMEIQNPAGENLGEVDDIILDNQQGRIAYAVVSYGGILGIGEKHFAVPWQAFSTQDDKLVLNVEKEQLKSAPGFEKGKLPDHADPMFHEQVHDFYGAEPYDVSESPGQDTSQAWESAEMGEEREEQTRAQESQESDEAWNWRFWTSRGSDEDWARRLSEVIGTQVVDRQNESIGDIDDLAIDMREGRVTFALVSYGGIVGQTAAVPWNALELDREQEQYALDATSEDLEIARLETDELSRLEDEQFSRTIHEAFDTEPYWVAFGYDRQQQDEQRMRSAQQPRAQIPAEPRRVAGQPETAQPDSQRMSEGPEFSQSSISLAGTVRSVEEISVAQPTETGAQEPGTTRPLAEGEQEREAGLHVQLEAEDGQRTEILHIASAQALEDQNIDLSEGQEIEVKGFRTWYLGEPVIEVTELNVDGQTVEFEPQTRTRRPTDSI